MSDEDRKAVESAIEKLRFQKENYGFMERFTVDENWVALQALEKQIPKEPKIVEAELEGMDMETGEEYTYKIDEAHCSRCDCLVGTEFDRYASFCPECGQEIDWSIWAEES